MYRYDKEVINEINEKNQRVVNYFFRVRNKRNNKIGENFISYFFVCFVFQKDKKIFRDIQ
jgi:hypothetical protein